MREGIDTFLTDVADNVVFTGARSGFRIEGKEAFRTFPTYQWQNYPTRQGLARQVTRRVFQEGNVVVVNGYNDQTFIDKSGTMSVRMNRTVRRGSKPGVAGCSSISMSPACRAARNQGFSPYRLTSLFGEHGHAVRIFRRRDPRRGNANIIDLSRVSSHVRIYERDPEIGPHRSANVDDEREECVDGIEVRAGRQPQTTKALGLTVPHSILLRGGPGHPLAECFDPLASACAPCWS